MSAQRYLIALGSNQRHQRHGAPERVLAAALRALADAGLAEQGIAVERVSPILRTAPLGPSLRRYANAAALIRTSLEPEAVLAILQKVEHAFGRTRRGQRWGARVLDLDIVLWSGGIRTAPHLTIPHPEFRKRLFVLAPALQVAPDWRDPVTGRTLRQLAARLTRPRATR